MTNLDELLVLIANSPLGIVLYPVYLLLVFITIYYIALVP